MNLRKGKTKTILESSIDSALLAVEVYNKPRTAFRSEAYISLMVMAWTRLFHAYFNANIGDKFYYKKKNSNRYARVDGERKAWELKTCMRRYGYLPEPIKKNLEFFIGLRNKIEHRHIDRRHVDTLIFGQCQSLLFNYESMLVDLFGNEYALNESLVYSLQFSHMRRPDQEQASKVALSKDVRDIANYVDKFLSSLPDDVFQAQEFSIKLLQVPKISNTNRSDLAIEFVRLDELSEEDKAAFDNITAIVKDKKVVVEAANVGKLKPGGVVGNVNRRVPGVNFTMHTHICLVKILRIRPYGGNADPFDTDTRYSQYDEVHGDYVYTDDWVDFIVDILQSKRVTVDDIKRAHARSDKWSVETFLTQDVE